MAKKRSNKKRKQKIKKIVIAVIISVAVLLACLITFLILRKNSDNNSNNNPAEPVILTDINVLLINGESTLWDSVTLSNDEGMTWVEEGVTHSASPNEQITFSSNRDMGTVIELTPAEADGRFAIITGNKGDNYPGTIQLHYTTEGVQVTNYVPLEEYIKGVICSEMPASYGLEALKAQAVCARSYVQSKGGVYAYEEAEAHVDDTVSYQVYGKTWADSVAAQAVDETAGVVVKDSAGNVANTMFYSTSCGYSQTQKAAEFPYLGRVYISLTDDDMLKNASVSTVDKVIDTDNNFEEAFSNYIKNGDVNALENDMSYFRWTGKLETTSNIGLIEEAIITEYNKGVVSADGTKKVELDKSMTKNALDAATHTLNKDNFGQFKAMKVNKRSTGGVITSLTMEFEGGCVIINDELVIRRVIGAAAKSVILQDGSKRDITILPSAAFTFDVTDNGYTIYGGGFGHGCGMSQNAAKALAGEGKDYIEILKFFYKGCEVGVLQ